jgi:hypothetical protein
MRGNVLFVKGVVVSHNGTFPNICPIHTPLNGRIVGEAQPDYSGNLFDRPPRDAFPGFVETHGHRVS